MTRTSQQDVCETGYMLNDIKDWFFLKSNFISLYKIYIIYILLKFVVFIFKKKEYI